MTCSYFVLCTVYVWILQSEQPKETERKSNPDYSPLSASTTIPSYLSFRTISSNWILCGDALSPISSLFHPSHGAFSSPFSASTTPLALYPPYLRQDKHLSASSVQYFTTMGRMFYLLWLENLQRLLHNSDALHNTVAGACGSKSYTWNI